MKPAVLKRKRGSCIVFLVDKSGACRILQVPLPMGDQPVQLGDGVSAVLDSASSYESPLWGHVYVVPTEEGRSVRYGNAGKWDGPSGSRLWRTVADVRAKQLARVEPEGLFGFLAKMMPLGVVLLVLMVGWMLVSQIGG